MYGATTSLTHTSHDVMLNCAHGLTTGLWFLFTSRRVARQFCDVHSSCLRVYMRV
jgi:hypothetical protein